MHLPSTQWQFAKVPRRFAQDARSLARASNYISAPPVAAVVGGYKRCSVRERTSSVQVRTYGRGADEARRELIARTTRDAIAERKRAGTYRRRPFVDRSTVEVILGPAARRSSLRRIAPLLDLEGHPTARGGPWRHSSVRAILARENGRAAGQERA